MADDDAPDALCNLDAERAVLGSVLLDAKCWIRVAGLVMAADFHKPHHGSIFAAMDSLAAAGSPLDSITVDAELRRQGHQGVGGLNYLAELQAGTPTAQNVGHWAHLVRERSVARFLVKGLAERIKALREGKEDSQQALDQAAAVFQAGQTLLQHPPRTALSVIEAWAREHLQPSHRIGATWWSETLQRALAVGEFKQRADADVLNA